jgi:hypothetical protein
MAERVKLGQHRGAFTGFRFDVTGILRQGRNDPRQD